MKKLLLIGLTFLCASVYGQSETGVNGGKLPSKGVEVGYKSVDGKFYYQWGDATTVVSTALEASHVLKASAGSLVSLHVYNTKGSAQFILIMNSATVPGDGAVTLLYPPIAVAASSNFSITFPVPLTASTGISVSNSSTGTFTKTIGSADCVFAAQVQ